MDQVTMWFSMCGIIANYRIPFSINQSLELDAEFYNPLPFPDVIVPIAVVTFPWVKVDQEFSLSHTMIIQQEVKKIGYTSPRK